MREPILTTADAADYLGVTKKTLLKYCKRGQGPVFMPYPGGEYRFRESSLDIWMKRREVHPGK
jgi:excisionase family DNA binding protein